MNSNLRIFALTAVLASVVMLGMAPRWLTEDGKIVWTEDYRLEWGDFQGRPDRASTMLAMTESGIDFGYLCDGWNFTVNIIAKFDPSKSWKKRTASDHLLPHEQLHFDITELMARKMRKAFEELHNPCGQPKGKLERLAKDYFAQWNALQNQYDQETHHSMDKELQKKWEEKIAKQLKALEDYAL